MAEQPRESRFCDDELENMFKPLGASTSFQALSILSNRHRELAIENALRDTRAESIAMQQKVLLRLLSKATPLPSRVQDALKKRLHHTSEPWLFLHYSVALLSQADRDKFLENLPGVDIIPSLEEETICFVLQMIAVYVPVKLEPYLRTLMQQTFPIVSPLKLLPYLKPETLSQESLLALLMSPQNNPPPKEWQFFLREHYPKLKQSGIIQKLAEYTLDESRLSLRVWIYAVLPETRQTSWQEDVSRYLRKAREPEALLSYAGPDLELQKVLALCAYKFALLSIPSCLSYAHFAIVYSRHLNSDQKFALVGRVLNTTNWSMLSSAYEAHHKLMFDFIVQTVLELEEEDAKMIVFEKLLPTWGEHLFLESFPVFESWITASENARKLGQQEWFCLASPEDCKTSKERFMWAFILTKAQHKPLENVITRLLLKSNDDICDLDYNTPGLEASRLMAFALPYLETEFAKTILSKFLPKINHQQFVSQALWFAKAQYIAPEQVYYRLPNSAQTLFFNEWAKTPGLSAAKLTAYEEKLQHHSSAYKNPLLLEEETPEALMEDNVVQRLGSSTRLFEVLEQRLPFFSEAQIDTIFNACTSPSAGLFKGDSPRSSRVRKHSSCANLPFLLRAAATNPKYHAHAEKKVYASVQKGILNRYWLDIKTSSYTTREDFARFLWACDPGLNNGIKGLAHTSLANTEARMHFMSLCLDLCLHRPKKSTDIRGVIDLLRARCTSSEPYFGWLSQALAAQFTEQVSPEDDIIAQYKS